MPTVVLRDGELRDVGFLLGAGGKPIFALGQRDVLLMSLPSQNNSPAAEFIRQNKHVEFPAFVTADNTGSIIDFAVATGARVKVSFRLKGAGTWSIAGVNQGTCEALPE
jgi:hypothetical protein